MGYLDYGTAEKENEVDVGEDKKVWTTHTGKKFFVKFKEVVTEVNKAYYDKAVQASKKINK